MFGLTPRISRHRLRPLLAATLLPALALLCSLAVVRPHTAHAFDEWCFDDPIVALNGTRINTTIGVNGHRKDVKQAITSSTLVYQVPAGVSTRLISSNSGLLNPQVVFVTSNASWSPGQPIPVNITVSFQSSESFATQMATSHHGNTIAAATGSTDTGMASSFTLAPPPDPAAD